MNPHDSAKLTPLNILMVTLLTLDLLGQFAFDARYRRGTHEPKVANATLAEGTQCTQPSQRSLYD
jgi:hypothetical protein